MLEQPVAGLPAAADRAFERVGRVALAVALLAAAIRGGARTWEQLGTDLDAGEQAFGQHPYANAFKAMQIATATLDEELQQALLGLAVFPPDTRIPVVAIARYWAHTRGHTAADTGVEVERLAAAGLLQYQDGHIGFHDLQYDYLLLHAPATRELHTALVAAYRGLLPTAAGHAGESSAGGARWWRLPPGEPYIRDHLVGHLRGAGLHEELRTTVTDPAYLARRVDAAGVYAAEADLAQAAQVYAAESAVRWWRGWLARHAHLLADDVVGVGGVVATFAAWLRADATGRQHGVDPDRLEPLLPVPCPRLRWGLTPPATALVRVVTGHTGGVLAVGWSPDGSRLVSGGYDGTVRVWQAGSGRLLHTLTGHTGGVLAVGWSPDGSRLVSGGYDGTVRVWDPTTEHAITLAGHPGGVRALAWSPDGTRLVTSDGGKVRVWDPTTGTTITTLSGRPRGVVSALAWSPDGIRLATGGSRGGYADYGEARVWEAGSGRLLHTLTGHTDGVSVVGWSPDGIRLATASGGSDETVRVWEADSGRLLHTLTGHTGGVTVVGWSPDGSRLVSGGSDETVRVWEADSGRLLYTLTGHTRGVTVVGWSPDGSRLVSGGYDETVRVWEADSGELLYTLTGHTDRVSVVGWSPDGSRLVSGGSDGTIRIWQPTATQHAATTDQHAGRESAVGWSPDGSRLVSGGHDETVRVWEADSGRLLHTLLGRGIGTFARRPRHTPTGHTGVVRAAVGWSPDGSRLVSGGYDETVRVWEADSGRLLHTLTGHTGGVLTLNAAEQVVAVGWSPDGSRLVSGGDDTAVRVWEATSGRLLHTLTGHTRRVNGVGWSPDGTRLVSGGADARLVLWSLHTLKPDLYLQLEKLDAVSWASAGIAVGGVNGVAVFDLR